MTATNGSNRRGLVWAIAGAAVLAVAVIAVLAIVLIPRGTTPPTPAPTPSPSDTGASSGPSTAPPEDGEVVDPSARERGWVGEPITTDPDEYMRAALAAASTFDTTLSTRDEWLAYLDTWFTPDTRYVDQAEREARLAAAQLELRQGVVLPGEEWDMLAASDGRVAAVVTGDISTQPVPDDASGDMAIGTADVTLTYSQADGSGEEASFEETVRVSVQVLCGAGSVPTPGTAQQVGDCKVVRYFTEPLEP